MSILSETVSFEKTERRVVICGSLSFYKLMLEARQMLIANNVRCVIPEPPSDLGLSELERIDRRRRQAFDHLTKIKNPRTHSILVVNPEKRGIPGYIGPSTFAEIAVAFAHSKKIYTMFDFPSIFDDELTEWRAIPLLGSLNRIIADYIGSALKESTQLELPLF